MAMNDVDKKARELMRRMMPHLKASELAHNLGIHQNSLNNLIDGIHKPRDPELLSRAYNLMRERFLPVQVEVQGIQLPDLFTTEMEEV